MKFDICSSQRAAQTNHILQRQGSTTLLFFCLRTDSPTNFFVLPFFPDIFCQRAEWVQLDRTCQDRSSYLESNLQLNGSRVMLIESQQILVHLKGLVMLFPTHQKLLRSDLYNLRTIHLNRTPQIMSK